MPAKRSYGMDQDFYPWSPIVTRPVLRWPDNARVALAVIVDLERTEINFRGTNRFSPFETEYAMDWQLRSLKS